MHWTSWVAIALAGICIPVVMGWTSISLSKRRRLATGLTALAIGFGVAAILQ